MPPEVSSLVEAVNSGANVALIICLWFLYKAVDRLARIETALFTILTRLDMPGDAGKLTESR